MDETDEAEKSFMPEEEIAEVFELVSRKRKGKKKLKLKSLQETTETDNSQVQTDGRMSARAKISVEPTETIKSIPVTPEIVAKPIKEIEIVADEINAQNKNWNKRALPEDAETYQLEKFKKNAMLIFNHHNIIGYPEERWGTDKDVEKLKETFNKFGFEVDSKDDLTKDDIMTQMDSYFSNDKDFKDYGCVAVVILTHGTDSGYIYAKDHMYHETEILKYLTGHSRLNLVTKPKILIIQACRGTQDMAGVTVLSSSTIRKDSVDLVKPYTLPVEADTLVLHSSYTGKQSHRDLIEGTWFIQSLCKKIDDLAATEDFQSIIVHMQRDVAINKEHSVLNRATSQIDINKQMPVTTSTLIRKLYLRRFGDELPPSQLIFALPSDAIKSSVHSTEDNSVMDSGTPIAQQYANSMQCDCYSKHFEYMKIFLRQYLKDHSNDKDAENFLNLAEKFKPIPEFDEAKQQLLITISENFSEKIENSPYLRYVHFYQGRNTK